MRVAWFSPLNTESHKSQTLAAYTSDALLPLLKDRCEITVFHNRFDSYKDFHTEHYLTAEQIHEENPFDVFFYQMEDGLEMNFMRIQVGLMPGVTWFHGMLFSTDGPEPILNSPWEVVLSRFKDESIDWPERGEEFYKKGAMGLREGGYALLPLFSSRRALSDYSTGIENSIRNSLEVTNLEGPFILPVPVPSSIARFDLERDRKQVAFCGTPRVEHRAHKLLEAISKSDIEYHLHWLIAADERAQVEDLLHEFGIEAYSLYEGRSPEKWIELLPKAGVAVHTHFSVFGQTAPYLQMSMMAGLPCIATSFGDGEVLSEDHVFKIESGIAEAAQIRGILDSLSHDDSFFSSDEVRSFALEEYDAESIANELYSVFENSSSYLAKGMKRWEDFNQTARQALMAEAREILNDGIGDGETIKPSLAINPIFKELGWSES